MLHELGKRKTCGDAGRLGSDLIGGWCLRRVDSAGRDDTLGKRKIWKAGGTWRGGSIDEWCLRRADGAGMDDTIGKRKIWKAGGTRRGGSIGGCGGPRVVRVMRCALYRTCLLPSWPIYLFIGHVASNLGQYIHLLDTLSSSWPIYPSIGHVASNLGQYLCPLDMKCLESTQSRH